VGTIDEQLLAWLNRIAEVAESIKLETDVDDCLWPAYPVSPLADQTQPPIRLLELLGYGPDDVSRKKRIPLARGKGMEPDFVITVQGEEVLVIEDKAPDIRIDDWIGQMRDYFLKVDAPLGMIFNTRRAMLIINTRLPELSEFENLESRCVLEASIDGRSQMQQLLNHLVAPSSRSEMLAVARSLAEQRVAEIKREQDRKRREGYGRKRLGSITDRISEIKADPPDYLLTAIIANDEKLKQIRSVKPGEVRDAWLAQLEQL